MTPIRTEDPYFYLQKYLHKTALEMVAKNEM